MVKRQIKWTARALGDRTEIMDYWYNRTKSVDFPLKLEHLFSTTLTLLSGQPRAGKFFDEKRNIRFALARHYRIYYTYSDRDLTVLCIWDTRRNEAQFEI